MLLTEISCVKISNFVNQIILQAILIRIKMGFPLVVNLLSVNTWWLMHIPIYADFMARCSADVEVMDLHWSFSEYFSVIGTTEGEFGNSFSFSSESYKW